MWRNQQSSTRCTTKDPRHGGLLCYAFFMIVLYTKPVPINQKYGIINGRNLLTKKYRDTKETLSWEIKSQWPKDPLTGEIVLNIIQYFGDNRRRDIDAYLKIILDAAEGVLYEDDTQIVELNVIKAKDLGNPRIELSVLGD